MATLDYMRVSCPLPGCLGSMRIPVVARTVPGERAGHFEVLVEVSQPAADVEIRRHVAVRHADLLEAPKVVIVAPELPEVVRDEAGRPVYFDFTPPPIPPQPPIPPLQAYVDRPIVGLPVST